MSKIYWLELARQGSVLPFLASAAVEGVPVACVCGPFSRARGADAETPWPQRLVEAESAVAREIRSLAVAGSPAIVVEEPELNVSTLPQPFESVVLEHYARLREVFLDARVDALLQVTGVLTRDHVSGLARALHPAVLSLGPSRPLCEDVALVPKDIVLHGNLDSSLFTGSMDDLTRHALRLRREMRATGHPHLLGTDGSALTCLALPEYLEALLTV